MANSKKKPELEDENAMITPEKKELPDFQNITDQDTEHYLNHTEDDDVVKQLKKFLSLTVVGLIAVGLGTFIGVTQFNDDSNNNSSFTLASTNSSVLQVTGAVEVSSDSGITWSDASEGFLMSSGMNIRTGANSKAAIALGSDSQVDINANSEIMITSLNSIKVAIDIRSGSVEPSITDADNWTFEVTSGEANYISDGDSTASITEAGSLEVTILSGKATSRGEEFAAGQSFSREI